jgi:hypothetical protein
MKHISRFGISALMVFGVLIVESSTSSSQTAINNVCVNKKTGSMRYLLTNSKQVCNKTEVKLIWNQTGVAGAKGDTGATGAKGDTGASGAKGDTGASGAKGDTGATGATGDAGTNGALTNSQIKNICGVNGTTACALGVQGPGGGIVFMTPSTLGNTSGLFYEAAPSTWSSLSGDPTSAWCNNTSALLGVASTVIGTGAMDGAAKTTVMLSVCTSGAANLADEYTATVNGVVYGDWFLPSKGELNQMYTNLHSASTPLGGFSVGYYWTSSEFDRSIAWTQGFGIGDQTNITKGYLDYVRPVRAF